VVYGKISQAPRRCGSDFLPDWVWGGTSMTHEEQIAKLTEMLEIQQKLHETAIDMLKPAIEAEREACAKLVEDSWMAFSRTPNRRLDITPFPELEYVAKVIRARGQA
jgi:hypothetical protein